jgi:hypothetical protein
VKSHPGFEKHQGNSISRMLAASAIIAVATSVWGCSPRIDSSCVESFDDWDSSRYAPFRYSAGNISNASASVAYLYLGDDSAVARSGYTDPRWERAELRSERAGDALFPDTPATNDRVLEIPPILNGDNDNTAAAISSREMATNSSARGSLKRMVLGASGD